MFWNDKIGYPKIVGTGAARSGTYLLSDILTQGGITMTHELGYGSPGYFTYRDNAVGDVSTFAAPFLMREKERGVKVLQMVRHPLKVISSMVHSKAFEYYAFNVNVFTRYVEMYIPEIHCFSILDRNVYYWLKWNQMIKQFVDLIYRLEDIVEDPYEIFKDLGHDLKGKEIKVQKMNYFRDKVKQLDWKDLEECEHYNELLLGAEYYGYLKPEEVKKLKKPEHGNVIKNNIAKTFI